MRRPLAACALFLAFGIGARQQPTGRQPPQTPTFRAGTNLVQVDVIVADRSDRPLLELTAADFEVYDDGAPVPIAAFRFLHTSSEQTADPIRRDADEEREAKRDDVRLFAIFLDDYHVSWASQHNAIEPLVQFVQGLPPVDLVAVYNPIVPARDVRFSRDRAETIRIIRAFEGRQGIYVPPKYPAEEEHLRQLPMIERLRAQVTYTALEGLAIHLGGLKEGRKSLIVVSERLSMDLADLDELVHTANRNNVSLYPLDPRGLLVGADRPIALVPSMRGGMSTSTTDLFRVLADETSGRAIVGRNDLDRALAQVSVDTSAYYLLGYVSPHPNDGKFHAVTVRVKRPRVTVRARKGYWAWTQAEAEAAFPPPPAAVEPAVQQALNGLADSLRPDPEAPARRRVGPPDAPAPIAKSLTALGEPAMAIARLRAEPQPVARREFTRRDQVIIQVAVADPPPSVIVTLRDHLGQRLTDLPASMASGACTVRLALGSLGPGDYVVEFTATSGSGVPERRHIAFRVVP